MFMSVRWRFILKQGARLGEGGGSGQECLVCGKTKLAQQKEREREKKTF